MLVAGAKLQTAIETRLSIQVGATVTVKAERELETPADTISIVTLQWEEIWDTGNVNIVDDVGNLEGEIPFRILTTLRLSQKGVEQLPCPTVSVSPIPEPTITLTYLTNTPVPVTESSIPNCPYVGSDDFQTFINIIKVEEKANLTEDIELAKSIYFNDAIIRDVYEGITWDGITWNVTDHYIDLFERIDFVEIDHFDVQKVKSTEDTAWVKTSDYGIIIIADTNERVEYGGEGGTHFIFKKNESGCWLISYFSKGAENEPFP